MYFSVISAISLVAIMASGSNALPVSNTQIAARVAEPVAMPSSDTGCIGISICSPINVIDSGNS